MKHETIEVVVPSRRKRVMWESLPEGQELLIRCETPTLTGGVPTDWIEQYLEAPDDFGFIGERDTEGAAMVQAVAMMTIPVSRQDPDEGIADFELDTQLEDRLDTCEHAVVFNEATR